MPVADEFESFASALDGVPTTQGRFERLLRIVIRAWCRVVGWDIETGGWAALPARAGGAAGSGCIVVAAPHRAWLEPFLLLAAWPPHAARLVWLADGETVARSWWRRRLLPRLGVIPVVGGIEGPARYAAAASAVLSRGAALAVFPEVGQPSEPDAPRRISPGFAYLARHAGAPILPVVIAGTHHIVRGSRFSVDLLPAIDVGSSDPRAFSSEGRAAAHEIRDRYVGLIREELPTRNARTDARRPSRDRWRWLGTLFR